MARNKHPRIVAPKVPPALPADVAAAEARKHDEPLTAHHFTDGEHPIVRIEHLNKTFDGVTQVLRDVNLDVWPGEVVVVLGPSGSGKSTMLRCINLLETPTAGHILIEDEEITGDNNPDVNKLRRDLGMVFQGFNLFPHLTAKGNVMIGQTKVLKKDKAEAEAEAMRQLAAVGLADRADYKPAQLSGGQQQRVAIARALITKPAIILADEPTGSLDSQTSADVLELLRRSSRRFHQTVVMITHNDHLARLADRIVRMGDGRIVG